jgi:HK97 family phage major capsid protein
MTVDRKESPVMPHASDALLARYQTELEDNRTYQDKLVEDAQTEGRDLTDTELEQYKRSADRMRQLETMMAPLRETHRINADSSARMNELTQAYAATRTARGAAGPVEYRSAGEYVMDSWQAGLGSTEAAQRLDQFTRAAQHQTTADNLGVIPEPIVGPVVNFIDASRPVVAALGPRAVPGGRFNRPKVTQHTDTALQTNEKDELVSRKMLITRLPVTMATYGGYVNVSRQDIDFSSPQIMDTVIQDLAGQYAIDTETACVTALAAGAAAGSTLPTGTNTSDQWLAAIWGAAATSWTNMQGVGGLVLALPPGLLSAVGPLFPPYNPTNVGGIGFSAATYGQGQVGTISGIQVVMSTAVATNTALVINTQAGEVYEQRVGSLQVTEPSVLGVQVAYAGYFSTLIVQATGVVKITKTP